MTPERLAEIRARAEAATPGSWVAIAPSLSSARYVDGDFARFVEHARTDIPALLDYIEELQAVEREARKALRYLYAENTPNKMRTFPALDRALAALTSKEPTNA